MSPILTWKEGWKKAGVPGMTYQTFSSTRMGTNPPNLNAVTETSALTLKAFVKKSWEKSAGQLGLKVLKEEYLKRSDGKPAARVIIKYKLGKLSFRTMQYVLDAGKRKIILSGTTLSSEFRSHLSILDKSMATLKLEK